MSWPAMGLGLMLGVGVLLAMQGFAGVLDKKRTETDRRKAMWKLNGGIALAAISMFAFARMG